MKHKHCEVIKAWAEGKTVQFLCEPDGKWHDLNTPNFHTYRDYRVKPETMRYRVALFKDSFGRYHPGSYISEDVAASLSTRPDFVRWLTDWQEVEV